MISQFFSERLGHPTFPRVVKRPTFRKNNIYQMQIRTKIMSQSGLLFISCGIEFLSAVGTLSYGKTNNGGKFSESSSCCTESPYCICITKE